MIIAWLAMAFILGVVADILFGMLIGKGIDSDDD